MKIYTFDCEIITPLFMGGYGQKGELRTASFKGMLRWWFRALYGGHLYSSGNQHILEELHKKEKLIFGSTDNGGIFSISLFHEKLEVTLNGVKGGKIGDNIHNHYGAYGLMATRVNDGREFIKPGQKFTLRMVFKQHEEYIPYVVGALAAFNLWGGIGSRSTRGFGSILISNGDFPKLFPDLAKVTGDKIEPIINNVKAELYSIYKILSGNSSKLPEFSIVNSSHFSTKFKNTGLSDPNAVQKDFAGKLRKFRESKIQGSRSGVFHSVDYQAVYGSEKTPHDTIFGLPHNFSSKGRANAELKGSGNGRDRRVSPLRLKVIKAGGKYYQMLVLFEAQFLPPGDYIKGASKPLNQPGFARAKEFMKVHG
ncbi:MAG: hypothetical protein AMXMBFR48_14520 [Ignavibacteriales bacterium]